LIPELEVGGVSSEASSWRGIEIEFQPAEGAQFADAEGKPIVSVEDAFSRRRYGTRAVPWPLPYASP
jgi:hypothetical protein